MMLSKSLLQAIWDFVGIPFRFALLDQEWLPRLHWTTLEDERLAIVSPHIHGRLLDVGAGLNNLVKSYGDGIGVDVYDWGNDVVVVESSAALPYPNESFDTITFVACLNHIPYRQEALNEARRLIRPDGNLVITMINPILGGIGHKIWWYSEEKVRGGMKEGEVGGLWKEEVIHLCQQAGFKLVTHKRFQCGLNNLFIFSPRFSKLSEEGTSSQGVR